MTAEEIAIREFKLIGYDFKHLNPSVIIAIKDAMRLHAYEVSNSVKHKCAKLCDSSHPALSILQIDINQFIQ